MSTAIASIASIICLVGIIQAAFTKIINNKYSRCSKDIVKRFTSSFGIGNLLFATGSVMFGTGPAGVRFANEIIGFAGLAIMFTAYYKFKKERMQAA